MKKKILSKKTKKEKPVEKTPKVKTGKKKTRIWYWIMVAIVSLAILCILAGIGFCYYIVKSAPEYDINQMFEKEASRVFSSEGDLIATLGAEQRQKVSYDELPQVLIDAIIATEDSRFFQHNGFDAPRFLKASFSQVLGRGGGGASTLTMQLSKLAFTDFVSEGFDGIVRKFTDIYMAVFKMEKNLTKEEIIEYYVNTPCMGGNIYGVQQASQYYFGKDVKDLNLVEAAQIAGMFQSPNGYNPYVNPNDANDRKNTVLYLMKRHGYISEEQYNAGKSVKIADMLSHSTTATNEYQGFIDTVVQEIIDKTGNNPYNVPMDIYTTMITSKQNAINDFYKNYKFRKDKQDAGIAVVDVNTGALVAVGAGKNKTGAMTLNLATFHGQTKRMPGSTAKPIIDYGPAIEYENLSTYGPFIDEKTPYGSGYMRNFNGSNKGFMTTRDCLKNSVNTCALQAFRLTTNEQKYEFATSLGIDFGDTTKLPDSYSIGTFNSATPVVLAGAYSAFANGGYYTEPYSFTKIVYRESEETYEPKHERNRVMKETTAYMITSILTSATSGSVKVSGTQIATKTGTTSYDTDFLKKFGLSSSVIPDSWTSSYTKDYAMAIWLGFPEGLTEQNAKDKQYMLMGQANTDRVKIQATLAKGIYETNAKFARPKGLTNASVELETIPAASPSDYTPSSLKGEFMFISGTEPSETSTRFSKLSSPINVNYSMNGKQVTLSWVSPGTPNAIDQTYLTNYFNEGYTIWAEDYLNKRINYNKNNIGDFGFDVYLTQGTTEKHIAWISDTTYTIDLSAYPGYDGAIIRSSYSKFKSNASEGVKLLFTNNTPVTPDNPVTPSDEIKDSDIEVKMNGLNQVIKVGDKLSELTSSAIDSIKYKSTDIKTDVTGLNVSVTNVTKDNNKTEFSKINTSAGTYKITYSVTFTYKSKSISRTFTQSILVK